MTSSNNRVRFVDTVHMHRKPSPRGVRRDEDGLKEPFPGLHAETAHTAWGTSTRGASVGACAAVCGQPTMPPELKSLIDMSTRIGGNPLLVQGSTGNTSIKVGAMLWVKASGKISGEPRTKGDIRSG